MKTQQIISRTLSFLAILFFISCQSADKTNRLRMDLSGSWMFKMDSASQYTDSLILPGTTDTNKKGLLNKKMDETSNLSRTYQFKGKVWYQKTIDIPQNWKDKHISLFMERTKPTEVLVDDRAIGKNNNITTPQTYDLSEYLTPGVHQITIIVDNEGGVPPQILHNSHAYTESTQTNWNGIIGDFFIESTDKCYIQDVQIYPDYKNRKVAVDVKVKGTDQVTEDIFISCSGKTWNTSVEQKVKKISRQMNQGDSICSLVLDLGKDAVTWSEFHPALYKLSVSLKSGRIKDLYEVDFGLREFKTEGTQFVINDKKTFLRGKHDACVFPLTGHTAMDVETWRHYFKVAKEYGINHYRFHSWCPPEACFKAADIEGVYLQPELPFWGRLDGQDAVLTSFLKKEGKDIQKYYSNHASFVMFALGNEISGDIQAIKDVVNEIRKGEERHLFAYGSNNYLGFRGQQEGEDYLTTCRVGPEPDQSFRTHTRSSFSFADAYDGGYLNHTYPNTIMNFDIAVALCSVPVISHETGQYQVYPNYQEMKKYTGVLEPRNFAVFKERLKNAGMLDQAEDFFKASGKWAAELYRAEIEMDLRTKAFGGFQLLDLQDYPGQGSAYVGILDAFMDSKGLITPEKWREFCCEVVPLFETTSYTHTTDVNLKGKVCIANYSETDLEGELNWSLNKMSGEIIDKGILKMNAKQGDVTSIGCLDVNLSSVQKAEKCTLVLSVKDSPYRNEYSVWIYPAEIKTAVPKDILVTDKWNDDLVRTLRNGGKVLWFPSADFSKDVTVGALFQTDYWNYRMFKTICQNVHKPVSPGTMGLLMNPKHPLFADFPTEYHTNWQWFPIIKQSRPMILDRMPDSYRPIVQVIDNIERNHKLGLVFEFKVESGKLLICMSDLLNVQNKPEARQFYSALLQYMESDKFIPSFEMNVDKVRNLFKEKVELDKIETLNNISYE